MPPGNAKNTSTFILSPHQTHLRSAPSLFPPACQAMSHEGSPRPGRTPTKEREYGTTPRSHRAGPAPEGCSPLGAPRSTTPPGQVFEPSGSEDAKLEAEAARVQQEGSSPQGKRRQEGSLPYQAQRQEGPARSTMCSNTRSRSWRNRRGCENSTCDSNSGSLCSSRPC